MDKRCTNFQGKPKISEKKIICTIKRPNPIKYNEENPFIGDKIQEDILKD